MALEDIKKKILDEAQTQAAKITADAEKLAAEKLTAAQKLIQRERQAAKNQLLKEREQALRRYRQLSVLESEQKVLALKRGYLQQVLELAVERIVQKKLTEFYAKIFQKVDFTAAQIFVGGDTASAAEACQLLGITPKIILKKEWPVGRLEIDYGRSRLDCSLALSVQELAQTLEAELAERLWP